MNFQFKFLPESTAQQRESVLSALTSRGAEVEQIFPGDRDGDLRAMYTARIDDGSRLDAFLSQLRESQVVAYAEPEADRAVYLPDEVSARTSSGQD